MNLEQIDTTTTAGKAEVMRLAAEGRKVAIQVVDEYAPRIAWVNEKNPIWDWARQKFAIIAEPVGPEEVWFTLINGNCDAGPYTYECTAVDRAQNYGGQPVRYVRDDLAGGKA